MFNFVIAMKGKQFYLIIIAAISIALAFPLFSQSAPTEKILLFHSHITVHSDSSMTVRETIKVQSAGIEIKRGIYRDFPTRYKDSFGNQYAVDFNVI